MTIFSKTLTNMLVCILSIHMQISLASTSLANSTNPLEDSNKLLLFVKTGYGQSNPVDNTPVYRNDKKISRVLTAVSIACLSASALILTLSLYARMKTLKERKRMITEKNGYTAVHNLANELKTPISMIYNPIKNIIESKSIDITTRTKLESVIHQTDIMTRMVNIIMEGTDEGIKKKGVCTESVDLNKWIDYLADEFMVNNEGRNIVFKSEPDPEIDTVILDKEITSDAIFSVFDTILSYCTDECTITMRTTVRKGYYLISIENHDIDLQLNREKLLFTSLSGDSESCEIQKKGRDLSSIRIRMNLMGGDIIIRSGSSQSSLLFYIKIPAILQSETTLTDELVSPYRYESSDSHEINDQEQEFDTKNTSLLIVDDQQDLLDYMKRELRPFFKNIYTELDGKQALETITEKKPDVVVSDIIMPRINGFDLCRKIKTNLELSHIPVILLTSRTNPKVQEMGYKLGADAYLSKPFDLDLMYKLICSQIKNRQEIRKRYTGNMLFGLTENMTYSLADEQFVIKLNKLIKDNINNSKLGVSFLAEKLCMSRTSLFLKMNNLLGISAVRYIKRLRMEAAKELLTKTNKQINEIAACTGFRESQYFSTVFKQETGMTPKQFKEQAFLKKI